MSPLRRLGALLSGLLLLQLVLLSGDWSCTVHRSAATSGHDAMALAHGSHQTVVGQSSDDGCHTDGVPAACASMPSCATTLAVPARLAASPTLAVTAVALGEPVSIRSEPAAAPDAPPPRG